MSGFRVSPRSAAVVLVAATSLSSLAASGCGDATRDGAPPGAGQEGADTIVDADTTGAAGDTAGAAGDTAAVAVGGECLDCHRGLEEDRLAEPARNFASDVHGATGFGCVACHGGDATATTEREAHARFIGEPSKRFIPQLCARCHSNTRFMRRYAPGLATDQLDRYRTSVHGERLFEYGDTAVAVCTSCHAVHAMHPPSDQRSSVHPTNVPETCAECHADREHMRPYDIPTDQRDEYTRSVHWEAVSEGGDLSAPVCNDCHGNHGAAPPGVEWVGNVCGECHSRIADYFSGSVHDSVFVLLGTPGCATCHGNHLIESPGDEMFSVAEGGTCAGSGCHSPEGESADEVRAVAATIDSLTRAFGRADSILHVAEEAGMPVSEAQFQLQQGRNTLIRTRAITHTANRDSVEAAAAEGEQVADTAYARGEEALAELQWRRRGLGISASVILVLIVGLVLKIRQVEGDDTGAREIASGAGATEGQGREEGSND